MDTFYSLETKHYESSSSFAQNSAIAAKSRLWMTGSGLWRLCPQRRSGAKFPFGRSGQPPPFPDESQAYVDIYLVSNFARNLAHERSEYTEMSVSRPAILTDSDKGRSLHPPVFAPGLSL